MVFHIQTLTFVFYDVNLDGSGLGTAKRKVKSVLLRLLAKSIIDNCVATKDKLNINKMMLLIFAKNKKHQTNLYQTNRLSPTLNVD